MCLMSTSATLINKKKTSDFELGHLDTSSAFTTTGAVRIGTEIITYTGNSSDDLTGCTRGTAAPSYGKTPESTTALAHTTGAKVYGSYSITKIDETINYPGQPATETVSNQFTITLVSNATSTQVGGGYFVFGGPVNDRP